MKSHYLAAAMLGLLPLALVRSAGASEPGSSGLRPGESVSAFRTLVPVGPDAKADPAKKADLLYKPRDNNQRVAQNNVVALTFVRELTPDVVAFIRSMDRATASAVELSEKLDPTANRANRPRSVVVFCNDSPGMADQLKKLAAVEKLQHTALAIDSPHGPVGYRISRDAAITVQICEALLGRSDLNVTATFSFRKGETVDAASIEAELTRTTLAVLGPQKGDRLSSYVAGKALHKEGAQKLINC